jgi:hypothetical protein
VSVAALLERLREGAAQVDHGRLRVDGKRALAKLRDFRLANPHHYCLELLRAAVAGGATRVDARVDAAELQLSFDGAGFSRDVLEDLFGAALSGGKDADGARARLLAFGVVGALALKPKHIEVRSSGWLVRAGPPDHLEAAPAPEGSDVTGTRVQLRRAAGWRMVQWPLHAAREEAAIREHTAHFPARLFLDGRELSAVAFPGVDGLAEREKHEGPLRLRVAVPAGRLREGPQALLKVAVHGVIVSERRCDVGALPLVGWANDDRMRRNASGSDVVDDDPAFLALQETLEEISDALLADLVGRLDGPDAGAVRPLLRECAARVAAGQFKASKRARALLEGAPLLVGPGGEGVTLRAVNALAAAGKPIRVSTRPFPAHSYDAPVVLLGQVPALEARLGPRRQDVGEEAEARLRRDRNRARFEAQPLEEPKLPATTAYLARGPVEAAACRGEVGLPSAGEGARVRFLRGGRLLEQSELPALAPLRLVAVVDSETLSPDPAWRGALRDGEYERLVDAVRDAAVAAVAATLGDRPLDPVLRRHALDAVAAGLSRAQPLPVALRQAPLYEQAGAGARSVESLEAAPSLRYVSQSWPEPALDAVPVVVLDPLHASLWKRAKGPKKVRDMTDRLVREREIRSRLARPREPARLTGPLLAKVALEADGLHGELGVPEGSQREETRGSSGLDLRLLRDGFHLETRRLETPYGSLKAVVDAKALRPGPAWDEVVKDAAYEAVVAAIRAAEPRLLEVLAERCRDVSIDDLPGPAHDYVAAFLERHLAASEKVPEAARRAALERLWLETSRGRCPLGPVLEQARAAGRLWTVPPGERRSLSDELPVVVCSPELAAVLAKTARVAPEPPWEELARLRARAAFERRPQRSVALDGAIALRVPFAEAGWRGELGHAPDATPGIHVDVLYRQRALCTLLVENALPLRAVVDVAEALDPAESLPPPVEKRLRTILSAAAGRLVERALAETELPGRRGLLLAALAAGHDSTLPALRQQPLLPTTTGDALSLAELSKRRTIAFATRGLEGGLASGTPVVLAVDPVVRAALGRAGRRRRDATAELAAQLEERGAHERRRAVDAVRVEGRPLRRRVFQAQDVEGEVALGPGESATIQLYQHKRPLGREALPAPAGVEVAVNCDRLTPKARMDGVRHDAVHKEVLATALKEVEALAEDTAAVWPGLSNREAERLRPVLVRVAAWLLERKARDHPLLKLPLLVSSEGRPLSFADLARAQDRDGRVRVSDRPGTPLEPDAWVWQPRPDERGLLRGVRLVDVSEALAHADRQRAAPTAERVQVPVASRWREAVIGDGIHGEVALRPGPLVVELRRDGRSLESLTLAHPIGGAARVDCAALKLDPSWTKVERDAAFQAVRNAVDAALERAVARALREASRAERGDLARGAIAWRHGRGGPVAEALAALPLFREPSGREITVGRVLAEAAERGTLAVVDEDVVPAGAFAGLLVAVGPVERDWLARLDVELDDHSELLRREGERVRRLEQRRLPSSRYEGGALLRISVDEDGWRGELALPDPPERAAAIVLARAGIAVDRFHAGDLGVAGVLDHEELPVDPDWDRARLDGEPRERILAFVDRLFLRLSAEAGTLRAQAREAAAGYALRRLAQAGVSAAAHLDRLARVDDALARAPLFEAASGGAVDLRTLADQAVHGRPVTILAFADADGADGGFALRASSPGAAWVSALATLLGAGSVATIADASEWRRRRAEREPAPDDPLAAGLAELRRQCSLLRGDAVGQLSGTLLRDVRLHRAGGQSAVGYDAARGLGLLDPDHPGVRRALTQPSATDALAVLVSALYGAVNRALDTVGDEDESLLVEGLIQRLAETLGGASR